MASRTTLRTLGAAGASLAAALGVGAAIGTAVAPRHQASAALGDLTSLAGGGTASSAQQQGDDDSWAPQAPALSGGGAAGTGHAQSAGS